MCLRLFLSLFFQSTYHGVSQVRNIVASVRTMPIEPWESHQIAVYAGQGETIKLIATVKNLATREGTLAAQILFDCKDDFHQTAAHIAAKAGQSRKSSQCHAVGTILAIC